MYSKQNEKINQVDHKTLIIGVDIAKHKHVARAVDDRGIVLTKAFSFDVTQEGFNAFLRWLYQIKTEFKKSNIFVGFEPTGHYWTTFAHFLYKSNLNYGLVNPMHVKKSKELDDNTPSKNDPKDAVTIAKLLKDGRYSHVRIPKEREAEIRNGTKLRHEMIDESNRLRCQIHSWLDVYFPEFTHVFKGIDGKTAIAILKSMPLPEQINALSIDEIAERLRASGIKQIYRKKIEKLKAVAATSCGITEGLCMAQRSIERKMHLFEALLLDMDALEKELQEMVMIYPGVAQMLEIPGISLQAIVELFAEIGDIRNFEHPRQILKYAGLNLKESSSGKQVGKTQISKRGRKKLRALLYTMVLTVLQNQPTFKALHEYYTTRQKNPLKKMQSLIVLIGKLVRVLFTIGKNGYTFSDDVLRKQIPHLKAA
ncbi:MAG: IS110 family transposase [Bacilli bacterium]